MYVIRPLFKKYQQELVSFANSFLGKDMLSQFGAKFNDPIVKVTPDSVHELVDKDKIKATFHPKSPFVKVFAEVLTQIDISREQGYNTTQKKLIIPHFLGETKLLYNELPQVYLTSTVFNPNADPESTSMDAYAVRAANETWAQIRAGAGTFSTDTNANITAKCWPRTTQNPNFNQLERAIVLFDTSSIETTATISAATMSVYINAKNNHLGNLDISMVTSSPASNTSIANSDFSQLATTKQSNDITYANQTTSAYNDFTLNATGISNITKAGISKFGVRLTYDLADSPTPGWSGTSNYSGVQINSADSASNIPKLTVTYTVPSGAIFFGTNF